MNRLLELLDINRKERTRLGSDSLRYQLILKKFEEFIEIEKILAGKFMKIKF